MKKYKKFTFVAIAIMMLFIPTINALTINSDGLSNSSLILSAKTISCGKIRDVPAKLPELVSWGITIAEVVAIVILIVLGMIDMFKAMAAQKEDEIKKGQQMLIKRIIVAVLIFFIVAIVKLVVSLVSNSMEESNNIMECINCFISNKCN